MVGGHHLLQCRGERPLRIGQEGRDAGESLLLLGVEDVEDRADQQRMAGFLPMVAPLECAFRVNQDIGDILNVADLLDAPTDFEQRIIFGRGCVGRVSDCLGVGSLARPLVQEKTGSCYSG